LLSVIGFSHRYDAAILVTNHPGDTNKTHAEPAERIVPRFSVIDPIIDEGILGTIKDSVCMGKVQTAFQQRELPLILIEFNLHCTPRAVARSSRYRR
jgi:hypothetical protein